MSFASVSLAFTFLILLRLLIQTWLTTRQIRHVASHREAVPAAFASVVSPDSHRRAADYTIAKLRLSLLTDSAAAAVLLGWTLLGGLDQLNAFLRDAVLPRWGGMAYQLALLAAFAAIGMLIELPLDLYRTFGLEARFGFNRTTPRLFALDLLKGMAVGAVVGLPLAALVLWIMQAAGPWWWVEAWAVWTGFQLLMLVLYPTVIAPLFNRFEPLADEALAARVQALMQRCGFRSRGFYVMDGSRRSAHANAYFTGFGAAKRVVFFDTLLSRLSGDEVEAVLAHELGHFKHRHVTKRLATSFLFSLAGLALLGWLATQGGFYIGLGVLPNFSAPNAALALLLFMLALPVPWFFVAPLFSALSRRDEFQADAYAARQARPADLVSALLKLYEDNASTLTPDPLYVRFHYSHPPASARIAALEAAS